LSLLLALSLALFLSAIVFWRQGYLLTAGGIAVTSAGYIAAGQPIDVLSPYFGYVALLAWAGWRAGGGRLAYLLGATSLVLQSIVLLFDSPFGRWPLAPALSLALVPLVFSPVDRGNGKWAVVLTGLTALWLGWGLFRLFAGSPGEFVGGRYLLALAAVSVAVASLAASPRRFAGGLAMAAGAYLLAVYFSPPTLAPLLSAVLPFAVLLAASLPRASLLVFAAAAVALIYFSPLLLPPPAVFSGKLGPLDVAPDGSLAAADGKYVALKGAKFGVEGERGAGVFDVVIKGVGEYSIPLSVDFSVAKAEPYTVTAYLFPHVVVARFWLGDEVYFSYQLCRLSALLGRGCGGLKVSIVADITVYPNLLLFSLLWFFVLLIPVVPLYIKCTRCIARHK